MTSKYRIIPIYPNNVEYNVKFRVERQHQDTGEWQLIDHKYQMSEAKELIDKMVERDNSKEDWHKNNPIVYYP